MPQEIRLVGQSNLNIAVDDHTLATQTRVDARVYSTIDKILFFIGYFLDIVHTLTHVNMAGAAAANAAAVML